MDGSCGNLHQNVLTNQNHDPMVVGSSPDREVMDFMCALATCQSTIMPWCSQKNRPLGLLKWMSDKLTKGLHRRMGNTIHLSTQMTAHVILVYTLFFFHFISKTIHRRIKIKIVLKFIDLSYTTFIFAVNGAVKNFTTL